MIAPHLEAPCLIADRSTRGLKIRMDRAHALSGAVIIVDLIAGLAIEADVAWSKGAEAGLKERARTSLRGLTPSRLTGARAAWLRAGGR